MRQEFPIFLKYITFTVFTQPVIDMVAFRRELEMQWLNQYKVYFFVPSSPEEDRQSGVGRSLNSVKSPRDPGCFSPAAQSSLSMLLLFTESQPAH